MRSELFEVFILWTQSTTNMIVFLDLWLTLRNPFYDRNKRVKFYWVYLLVQTIFLIFALIYNHNMLYIEVSSKNEIQAIAVEYSRLIVKLGIYSNINYGIAFISILAVLY
jgi:hypothetical protein